MVEFQTKKRKRRTKQLTQEQIDWRNSILRGKIKQINIEQPLKQDDPDADKIRQCFYYLNNCVYWINKYINGGVDKKSLLEISRAMKEHATNLERILLSKSKIQ